MKVGTETVSVATLHKWDDGQTLGYAKLRAGHWQHIYNGDTQVGPVYPTREALLLDTKNYQSDVWGL